MDDARYDDLVRRFDGHQERADARLDRLEERLRLLERHTAAVLEQITALRRGLDEALDDLAEEDAFGADPASDGDLDGGRVGDDDDAAPSADLLH